MGIKINQGHMVLGVIGLLIAGIVGYGVMKNKNNKPIGMGIQENATTKVFPPPDTPFINASSPTSFGNKVEGPGSGCGCSAKRGHVTV